MSQDFYKIIVPAAELLDFDTASKWCRDINVADTDLVNILISSATELIEGIMNRNFVTRTTIGKFDCLSSSKYEPKPFIEVRRAPLIAISEIRVNGSVVSSSEYALKESDGFSRILFLTEPDLDADLPYPIEVDFTAGYGAAADVPDDIVTAVEQMVLFWYENRGDVSTDKKQKMPFVTRAIINKYRIVNTFG